ncbi:MAG: hypothetical protein OEU46_13715 [Alphaproteobacteria bacterium]|nr:hypothetical protein [Alphaproteobacteria bacterium]
MNKEEMQGMMCDTMAQMFAGMSMDEKKEMMMGMMGKMKDGINMEEMMSKMGAMEGPGGMKEMMAKMMQGGEEQESMMPEMMLKGMMPHCIKMMMPAISKEKRADLVSGMVGTLVEQASNGMSDEERAALKVKVVETLNA